MELKFSNPIDLSKNIFTILLFYKLMVSLLETYYSGFNVIDDGEINKRYLTLCSKIGDLLRSASIIVDESSWRPIDTLYVLDLDVPDSQWSFGGREIYYNFLSNLEEMNIKYGPKKPSFLKEDYDLYTDLSNYLEEYKKMKHEEELAFKQKCEKLGDNKDDLKVGFNKLHPTIIETVGNLYVNGNYYESILKTYIKLNEVIQEKTGFTEDGTALMEKTFSQHNPKLILSNDKNEQRGWMELFRGSQAAIRNEKAHKIIAQKDPQRTLEYLAYASLLLRLLDDAKVNTDYK